MFEFLDHFLVRALMSGLFLSGMCGPLGSLVLWQRLSFFGDTLSHAALLGVALALTMEWPLMSGVVLITGLIAGILTFLQNERQQSASTTLAILSQGLLALGIVWLSLSSVRTNLVALLFGDLLALRRADILTLAVLTPCVLLIIRWLWKDLLRVIINRDIAAANGIKVHRVQFIFVILLALCVALASRLVGVLLITSLLVIPPATARLLANSPEKMAYKAALFAAIGVVSGITLSWFVNVPTCPAITACALTVYMGVFLQQRLEIFSKKRKISLRKS